MEDDEFECVRIESFVWEGTKLLTPFQIARRHTNLEKFDEAVEKQPNVPLLGPNTTPDSMKIIKYYSGTKKERQPKLLALVPPSIRNEVEFGIQQNQNKLKLQLAKINAYSTFHPPRQQYTRPVISLKKAINTQINDLNAARRNYPLQSVCHCESLLSKRQFAVCTESPKELRSPSKGIPLYIVSEEKGALIQSMCYKTSKLMTIHCSYSGNLIVTREFPTFPEKEVHLFGRHTLQQLSAVHLDKANPATAFGIVLHHNPLDVRLLAPRSHVYPFFLVTKIGYRLLAEFHGKLYKLANLEGTLPVTVETIGFLGQGICLVRKGLDTAMEANILEKLHETKFLGVIINWVLFDKLILN